MKAHVYESLPVDANGYVQWTDTDNKMWATLVKRQDEIVKPRACKEFLKGLEILDFGDKVPQLPELNKILNDCTGWAVAPVPAVIQPEEFFTLLANKKFPAATFIRIPEEIDYIEEPDIFHELYGHTPLITNQAYADFLENFGKMALQCEPSDRGRLFRVFWFTVEFGLVKTEDGLKAYGGGILSSPGETKFCLTDKPVIKPYNAMDVLRTSFRIDIMQPLYFVLESFEDLFNVLIDNLPNMIRESRELGNHTALYPPKPKSEDDAQKVMKC